MWKNRNKTLEYKLMKDTKEDLDKWKNKIIFLDRKKKGKDLDITLKKTYEYL